MTLPADILDRIGRDFGRRAPEVVERLRRLAARLEEISPRIIRCVVHLAGRDLEKLEQSIRAAATDWRDVVYWAEYDRDDVRIHDFNEPFAGPAGVD